VPLVGLAGLFHYTNWLPEAWIEGRYVTEGVERFGRYFGRKGWFGFGQDDRKVSGDIRGGERDGTLGRTREREEEMESQEAERWHVSEASGRILVEVATAYAITKVFLPARVLLSVWATPWFARVVMGSFGKVFGRGKTTKAKVGAGIKPP